MSFDPLKVDLVSLSPDERTVVLHIVRDWRWTGTPQDVQSFQEKVQSYVSYALDGQMVADSPELEGLAWTIVVTSYVGAPDPRTMYVIETLQQRLPAHGGSLSVQVKPQTT